MTGPTKTTLLVILVLVMGVFMFMYMKNSGVVKHCYDYALMESVKQHPYKDMPSTEQRATLQDEAGEILFRECLRTNNAQWPESFAILRDKKNK